MYGLIGSFKAAPGRRDELIGMMLEGVGEMPGCLSYVIAVDTTDLDTIWITEVWTEKAAHEASLQIPEVKALIARAMPLIAEFGAHIVTHPKGGVGLGA